MQVSLDYCSYFANFCFLEQNFKDDAWINISKYPIKLLQKIFSKTKILEKRVKAMSTTSINDLGSTSVGGIFSDQWLKGLREKNIADTYPNGTCSSAPPTIRCGKSRASATRLLVALWAQFPRFYGLSNNSVGKRFFTQRRHFAYSLTKDFKAKFDDSFLKSFKNGASKHLVLGRPKWQLRSKIRNIFPCVTTDLQKMF